MAEVADEDFRRQVAVNLIGTLNGMREGAKRVRNGTHHQPLDQHVLAKELATRGVAGCC